MTPRSVRLEDAVELRLVRRLADEWTGLGQTLDSLSVWIIDDKAINAASIGDGIFILWSGLSELRDDELDAVYAHEVAHDQLKHSRRASDLADVTNVIGEAIGTLSGGGESGTRTLKRWTGKLVLPSYSRQQELAADMAAVKLLQDLTYEEPGVTLCRVFVRLRQSSAEDTGGFFASHPALTDRLTAIREAFPSDAATKACR